MHLFIIFLVIYEWYSISIEYPNQHTRNIKKNYLLQKFLVNIIFFSLRVNTMWMGQIHADQFFSLSFEAIDKCQWQQLYPVQCPRQQPKRLQKRGLLLGCVGKPGVVLVSLDCDGKQKCLGSLHAYQHNTRLTNTTR